MKMKSIFVMLAMLIVSPSLMATKFAIQNLTGGQEKRGGKVIQVRATFTGSANDYVTLDLGEYSQYDSGTHHVRYITWREVQGPVFGGSQRFYACYVANLEKILGFADRFRSAMVIRIYPEGQYTIDFGKGEQMPRQADPGNCEGNGVVL